MSAITSRPRVAELSAELIRTANLQAQLGCEFFRPLVSTLRVSASGSLATTLQRIMSGSTDTTKLRSPSLMRAEFTRLRDESMTLLGECQTITPGERMGIATAVALAGAGYLLEDGVLRTSLQAIRTANTITDATQATAALQSSTEIGHRKAVECSLARACAKASAAAGFATIETARGIDGAARVIATDKYGRALVSEIRVPDDRPPALSTEVVGIANGSCERILNEFDAALEALGVRSDGPPNRVHTGGVPSMQAARDAATRLLRGVRPPMSRNLFPAPCLATEEELEPDMTNGAAIVVIGGHDRG